MNLDGPIIDACLKKNIVTHKIGYFNIHAALGNTNLGKDIICRKAVLVKEIGLKHKIIHSG